MRYKWLLLVLSLIFFAQSVFADYPAERFSYKKVTKDNQYVFVMLDVKRGPDEEKLGEKYPVSGLYKNDGSVAPLWFIFWYSADIELSSDGKYLIRHGEWAQLGDKGETDAVAFYRDGKATRSYKIKDLILDVEAMPRSVSHYFWYKMWALDEEKNKLTIETREGKNSPSKKYVFDVTTGEPIKGESAEPIDNAKE